MRRTCVALVTVLAAACTADAGAQDVVEQQVAAKRNGVVQLVFDSKPGVCGDGETYISTGTDEEGRHSTFTHTRNGFNTNISSGDYRYRECNEGPVRVDLAVENGIVVDVDTYVGGEPRVTTISAQAAVDYLLGLAESADRSTVAKHALLPALLADVADIGPRLLRIARNTGVQREVRKSATFWLGQSGHPAAIAGLQELIDDADEEIAKSAIFAVSQLRTDEGARILLAVARAESRPTEVRKSAIFWLGQAAGEKATEGLKDLVGDEDAEIKKSAVFALSQMKSDQSLDALMDIAKNSKDREARKSALFWLGQSRDPRVLALFEEILLK
jgi:hypothetical protein